MNRYFIVFEKKTGKVIGRTYDEKIALSYVVKGKGVYDYLSFDEELDNQLKEFNL